MEKQSLRSVPIHLQCIAPESYCAATAQKGIEVRALQGRKAHPLIGAISQISKKRWPNVIHFNFCHS